MSGTGELEKAPAVPKVASTQPVAAAEREAAKQVAAGQPVPSDPKRDSEVECDRWSAADISMSSKVEWE
jgi:hypothetical protein